MAADIKPVLGARRRDIKQAAVLVAHQPLRRVAGRRQPAIVFRVAEREDGQAVAVGTIKREQVCDRLDRRMAVRVEQEDDAGLEPLRLVRRHHAHRRTGFGGFTRYFRAGPRHRIKEEAQAARLCRLEIMRLPQEFLDRLAARKSEPAREPPPARRRPGFEDMREERGGAPVAGARARRRALTAGAGPVRALGPAFAQRRP